MKMLNLITYAARRASLIALAAGSVLHASTTKQLLRVGYFPNVTHAQGIIGSDSTRQGSGWFEKTLGPDVEVQWFSFNAGPSAMEAIFAGSIDLAYVGPNPALNAYMRSKGDEIRVLAGAALGGAALVVRNDLDIDKPADFKGLRIATPQLGNTQDIAARAWFGSHGLRVTLTGGDVFVIPTRNPDQLSLFQTGRLDGVWTVEPWVSRLLLEAGGKIHLEQPDAVTTLLVCSARLLRDRPELALAFRDAHSGLTAWINENPGAAREWIRTALSAETRREIPAGLILDAWPRLHFTAELKPESLESFVRDAQAVGFLKDAIPLDRMFPQSP